MNLQKGKEEMARAHTNLKPDLEATSDQTPRTGMQV